MRFNDQTIGIFKGRRHQGEGWEGDAPRFHVLDDCGLILCGAVPRSFNKAKRINRAEINKQQFKPLCPKCRRVLKEQCMPRKRKPTSDQPRKVFGTTVIKTAAEQRAHDTQFGDALVQHARDWMKKHAPTMSVDVLACQPDRAIELGIYVGERLQRLNPDQIQRLQKLLADLVKHQDTVDIVASILRAVMNARKQGKLKLGVR